MEASRGARCQFGSGHGVHTAFVATTKKSQEPNPNPKANRMPNCRTQEVANSEQTAPQRITHRQGLGDNCGTTDAEWLGFLETGSGSMIHSTTHPCHLTSPPCFGRSRQAPVLGGCLQ
jgi:hypothetical protein